MLLILGVPDVVIVAIMGWEPGGAARMRARYMHVTGVMLRKLGRTTSKGPTANSGALRHRAR
ncbi:hypothetical protein SAMN05216532_4168 [Streptomyces sp. 2231.1]|nr:hypothetical protein SAMN05216532_4168 [Streptomyces sp. 2231.1]